MVSWNTRLFCLFDFTLSKKEYDTDGKYEFLKLPGGGNAFKRYCKDAQLLNSDQKVNTCPLCSIRSITTTCTKKWSHPLTLFFPFFLFFFFFLLGYTCFTVLCRFLLCSEVSQLSVRMCPLPLGSPSPPLLPTHLGRHAAPRWAPCALQHWFWYLIFSGTTNTQWNLFATAEPGANLYLLWKLKSC